MLPGNDSPRLDKNQRIPPPRPVAQEPRPENTAYRLNAARLQVSVSYESDLTLVRKTLEQVSDKLEWRSKTNSPEVLLQEFGDSSVNYSVDVWINDANDSKDRISDLYEAIWWALKDKDIRLAYRQLDLHMDQNSKH